MTVLDARDCIELVRLSNIVVIYAVQSVQLVQYSGHQCNAIGAYSAHQCSAIGSIVVHIVVTNAIGAIGAYSGHQCSAVHMMSEQWQFLVRGSRGRQIEISLGAARKKTEELRFCFHKKKILQIRPVDHNRTWFNKLSIH